MNSRSLHALPRRAESEVRGLNDTITEFNLEAPMQRMQLPQVSRRQVDAVIDEVTSDPSKPKVVV